MTHDVSTSSDMDDDLIQNFTPEEYWVVRPDGQTVRLVLSDRCGANLFFAGFAPVDMPLEQVSNFLWGASR